jgi:hypothetical protein
MSRFLLVMLFFSVVSFSDQLTIDDLLKNIDGNNQISRDIKAKVIITQQKPEQGSKVMEMLYYRRDADKSFLIIMTGPESEKGNGYLRKDDNFWMYRINTRTFQHINRDESIGGTEANGDDFEARNLTELYTGVKDSTGKDIIIEEKLGRIAVYRFEVKAKVNDVDYPQKTYWVRTDNYLILKEQAYSLSGSLMQTGYYLNYVQVLKRYVPVKMMFVDEFEKGNKSIVEISGIETNKLNDEVFTKAYLENLSK